MKVGISAFLLYINSDSWRLGVCLVDYLLFITANVDISPNPGEIRDHKWVNKKELYEMFDDPCQ